MKKNRKCDSETVRAPPRVLEGAHTKQIWKPELYSQPNNEGRGFELLLQRRNLKFRRVYMVESGFKSKSDSQSPMALSVLRCSWRAAVLSTCWV